MPEEHEALDAALKMAVEGDLVVINGDDTVRCWKQIIYFKNPDAPEQTATRAKPSAIMVGADELVIDSDALIRDERGVRLARGSGEAAD